MLLTKKQKDFMESMDKDDWAEWLNEIMCDMGDSEIYAVNHNDSITVNSLGIFINGSAVTVEELSCFDFEAIFKEML